MTCLDDEKYEELKSIVEAKISEERTAIDEFFERVKPVETKRQCNATEIFKKYFKILRKLYYLPTNDLRKMMEKKISVISYKSYF